MGISQRARNLIDISRNLIDPQTTYSDLLRPTQTYSECPEVPLTQEDRTELSGCLVDSVSRDIRPEPI